MTNPSRPETPNALTELLDAFENRLTSGALFRSTPGLIEAWERLRAALSSPAAGSAPAKDERLREGPGNVFICDKCGFELTRMIMRAADGAVGVDPKPHDAPCPNDGERMRPLTWKEDAERANSVGVEQMRRADRLQDLITSIQQVAAVHTGVLSNQIWKLCEAAFQSSAARSVDPETKEPT